MHHAGYSQTARPVVDSLYHVKSSGMRNSIMEPKIGSALVLGAVLAIGGIGLFFFMYFFMLAGASAATRLFGSLLVPPLVMAVAVGGYYILMSTDDAD